MNLVLKDFAARLQAKDLDLVGDFESTTTCKEHIVVEHLNCVDREVKHVRLRRSLLGLHINNY